MSNEDINIKSRNRWLMVFFIFCTFLCLLPALGIAFNSNNIYMGIPISLLWLSFCFFLLACIAVIGYKYVFKLWAEKIDIN